MDLKYLKHVVFYFFTAVISVILIYYVCYHMFDGFAQTITTVSAEKVTQNRTLTLDGYLMRDEQFIYSNLSGEVGYLYTDGDKVAAGIEIAQVYAMSNPEIRAQILELDEKIAIYERSNEVKGITGSNTSAIDSQIERLYLLLNQALRDKDAEYVYRKQNELLVLLNQRRIITRQVDSYDRQLAELRAEKQRLVSSLSGDTEMVHASASGFFYSSVDGYETIFSAAEVDTLTIERFFSMISAEPNREEGRTEFGYCVGKLVKNYVWYVACRVDRDQLRYFDEGSTYRVIFPYNGDAELSMKLYRVLSNIDSDDAVLVFETGMNPDNFHYLRMQTVNIVQATHEGYRVPISAVRLVDGVQGVYILQGNYVRFRAIQPLYEEDGYMIVAGSDLPPREDGRSWLEMYDRIIVEGKDLYDGKIVK